MYFFFTVETSQICLDLTDERTFRCDAKYTHPHPETKQAIPTLEAPSSGKCESLQCSDADWEEQEFSMEKFRRSCLDVMGTPFRNQPQHHNMCLYKSTHPAHQGNTHTHTLVDIHFSIVLNIMYNCMYIIIFLFYN